MLISGWVKQGQRKVGRSVLSLSNFCGVSTLKFYLFRQSRLQPGHHDETPPHTSSSLRAKARCVTGACTTAAKWCPQAHQGSSQFSPSVSLRQQACLLPWTCNTQPQLSPPSSSPGEHGGSSAGVTAKAHHHQLLTPPLSVRAARGTERDCQEKGTCIDCWAVVLACWHAPAPS